MNTDRIAKASEVISEEWVQERGNKDGKWHQNHLVISFYSKWDGEKFEIRPGHVAESTSPLVGNIDDELKLCRRYFEKSDTGTDGAPK